MSPAEKLFLPIYLFIMAVGYLHFFLCMLPSIGAALLLGRFHAAAVLSKRALKGRCPENPGYLRLYRSCGWRWLLAALAWDGTALAASLFLGRLNGWWIVLSPRGGQTWGGFLAALGYLLGRGLAVLARRNKEV